VTLTGRRRGPAPNNADVQGCRWYLSTDNLSTVVTVHLWGEPVAARDSWGDQPWQVRRCVVCGQVDTDFLLEQWKAND
jgi:hypothetical protein